MIEDLDTLPEIIDAIERRGLYWELERTPPWEFDHDGHFSPYSGSIFDLSDHPRVDQRFGVGASPEEALRKTYRAFVEALADHVHPANK